MDLTGQAGIKMVIPEDVQAIIAERHIRAEDLAEVLGHAAETGERFFNSADSSYLAQQCIGNITYWVRFRETEAGIEILNAYYHRMKIERESR